MVMNNIGNHDQTSRPGIEPVSYAWQAEILNHYTIETLLCLLFNVVVLKRTVCVFPIRRKLASPTDEIGIVGVRKGIRGNDLKFVGEGRFVWKNAQRCDGKETLRGPCPLSCERKRRKCSNRSVLVSSHVQAVRQRFLFPTFNASGVRA